MESKSKIGNLAIKDKFPLFFGHTDFTDEVDELVDKIAGMCFFLNGVRILSHKRVKVDNRLLNWLFFDEILEVLFLDDRNGFTGRESWDKRSQYGFKVIWSWYLSLNCADEVLRKEKGQYSKLWDGLWYGHCSLG